MRPWAGFQAGVGGGRGCPVRDSIAVSGEREGVSHSYDLPSLTPKPPALLRYWQVYFLFFKD